MFVHSFHCNLVGCLEASWVVLRMLTFVDMLRNAERRKMANNCVAQLWSDGNLSLNKTEGEVAGYGSMPILIHDWIINFNPIPLCVCVCCG